ncbi:MAG: TrmH family RNA methyltransferase [Polyangiaceae bacterium]|nr:TrmH family RNA methyltransferase [Polyangiaceae bacterium]
MPLDPPLDASPDEVRAALAPLRARAAIAVVALGNAFSIGAIIRVAHSYLLGEIILVGGERHYDKASMGMHRFETITRVDGEHAFFAHVAGRPVWAFERERARRSLDDVREFPDDVVLLFGSERFGLSEAALARADDVLAIPLHGVNNSLPVAVAAGIALSAWGRRRYRAGVTL